MWTDVLMCFQMFWVEFVIAPWRDPGSLHTKYKSNEFKKVSNIFQHSIYRSKVKNEKTAADG